MAATAAAAASAPAQIGAPPMSCGPLCLPASPADRHATAAAAATAAPTRDKIQPVRNGHMTVSSPAATTTADVQKVFDEIQTQGAGD